MNACTSKFNVFIIDLTSKIPKTAMFEVQEQITSHLPVFKEVMKDSSVFVCLRGRKFVVVCRCRKLYNSFSKSLQSGISAPNGVSSYHHTYLNLP